MVTSPGCRCWVDDGVVAVVGPFATNFHVLFREDIELSVNTQADSLWRKNMVGFRWTLRAGAALTLPDHFVSIKNAPAPPPAP